MSFLIFSVGPVQDFIASARKCRDLWFGSWLLSEVSRGVATTITERCGEQALIFPGSGCLSGDESVANKVVAFVDDDLLEEVTAACEASCRSFLDEQVQLLEDRGIFERGAPVVDDPVETAERQIRDLLETFWVAVPCSSKSGAEYVKARTRAEQWMAARKKTRDWGPSSWEAAVPKSALDGQREAVVCLQRNKGQSRNASSPGEYLCGVGLLKRMGEGRSRGSAGRDGPQRFHSTSHVAASVHAGTFDNASVRVAFDGYLDQLETIADELDLPSDIRHEFRVEHEHGPHGERHDGIFDGALLYPTRVIDQLEEAVGTKLARAQVDRVMKANRDFLKTAGITTANTYYALVLADGDRMGALINDQESHDAHRRLSRALEGFAADVSAITRAHHGSLIYAGGDDVLALVPLHHLLPFTRALSEAFAAALAPFHKHGPLPSLSVGVAIAHHMVHFGSVRQLAKSAEALAKVQRNSLAIVLDKRSGGERHVSSRWLPEGDSLALDQRLEHWIDLLMDESLPHGFIRELEDLARFARGCRPGQPAQDLDAVVLCEVDRIMDRKQARRGLDTPGLDDSLRKQIRAELCDTSRAETLAERVRILSAELVIALELRRARQTQEITPTEAHA